MRAAEFDALVEEHGLRPLLGDARGAGRAPRGGEMSDDVVRDLLLLDWLRHAPGQEAGDRPIPIGRCPVCRQLTYRGVLGWRYPYAVCATCEQRTTCLAHDLPVQVYERGLRFGDGPPSGSHHREPASLRHPHGRDGSPCPETDASSRVTIDGTTYLWREGRFGGTVVEPLPAVVRVVARKRSADVWLRSAPAGRGTLADLERDLRPADLGLETGRRGRLWSLVLVPPVARYARPVGVLDLRGSAPRLLWTEDSSYDVSRGVGLRLERLGRRAEVPTADRVVLHRDDVHAGDSPRPIEVALPATTRTYADLGRALVPDTGRGPVGAFPSVHGGSTWLLRDPYGDARAVGVLDLPAAGRPCLLWTVDPQQAAPSALQCVYLGGRQDADATADLIRTVAAEVHGDCRLSAARIEEWRERRGR